MQTTPRRQATCGAILKATAELIAEKGIDGFSISDVARHAGVNRSLIYHYYRDRDALLLEAVRHAVHGTGFAEQRMGPDDLAHAARMHIEHPEIARFFFQLVMTGRELPDLGSRMFWAIEQLERYQKEHQTSFPFDAPLAVVHLNLVQMAWAIAREEIARHLGVTVEEADERWLTHLRHVGERAMRQIAEN